MTNPQATMMKNKIIIPLIVGVLFGFISVAVSRVPAPVAVWSGMRVIANHVGYLLVALFIAYINTDNFLKSFLAGTLAIFTANLTYYILIHFGGALGLFHGHHIFSELDALAMWTVVGAACAALSTAAIRLVLFGRTKLLRYGAAASWYLAMLWVIYEFIARRVIFCYNCELWRELGYLVTYVGRRNFTSDVFEIIYAFVLVTIVLILLIRKTKKRGK
jgi:uncharacterized membrane protein